MQSLIGQFTRIILLISVAFLLATTSAFAEKRIALIIGNSAYKTISELKNPKNDAELMARTLEEVGFEVVSAFDADYRDMRKAVKLFGRKLRVAGEDTVGLFYYAGHGVQANGTNYLIPLRTEIDSQSDLNLEALDADDILRQMEDAGNRLNLVILDACRNNPFKGTARSGGRGLARMNAASGSLIAFATAPGQVAADGEGNNSPYTEALVAAIKQPGLAVEQVFKQARIEVGRKTGKRQTPWEESSLEGDFFFVPRLESALSILSNPKQQKFEPAPVLNKAERVYNQIKDSDNVEVLEIFIEQFPDSIYSKFARAKIKSLEPKTSPSKDPTTALLNRPRTTVPTPDKDTKADALKLAQDGDKAYNDKNFVESARLYVLASEKNHAGAMRRLGYQYANGKGVTKDYKKAARLYEMAVAQSDAGAMQNLAMLYESGQGVPKDYGEAVRLYKLAVAKNHAGSMTNLGILYENGQGIAKDAKEAARLYKLASDQDDISATFNLGILYKDGKGVSRDYNEAARLYKIAVAKNHAGAMNNLAIMYENGQGVSKDLKEAARLYKLAANGGNILSMYGLARMYENGWGVPRNRKTGADYMYRSINGRSTFSLNEMTTNSNAWSTDFRRELQRRMKNNGYYDGPIDGSFGPGTIRALNSVAAG